METATPRVSPIRPLIIFPKQSDAPDGQDETHSASHTTSTSRLRSETDLVVPCVIQTESLWRLPIVAREFGTPSYVVDTFREKQISIHATRLRLPVSCRARRPRPRGRASWRGWSMTLQARGENRFQVMPRDVEREARSTHRHNAGSGAASNARGEKPCFTPRKMRGQGVHPNTTRTRPGPGTRPRRPAESRLLM